MTFSQIRFDSFPEIQGVCGDILETLTYSTRSSWREGLEAWGHPLVVNQSFKNVLVYFKSGREGLMK
jgi:hypothetical protein